MKKIIAIALVLLLCLSMLVACGDDKANKDDKKDKTSTSTTKGKDDEGGKTTAATNSDDEGNNDDPAMETTLADAKDWLIQMYQTGKPEEAMVIKADKEVLTVFQDFTIAWSVTVSEGASDAVKISAATTDNFAVIDIADSVSAAVVFTVTATVSDADGNTEKVDFLFSIPGPVADPAADSELTIAQAVELGASKDHNAYTANKYYVSGTVVEVTKAEYGNMTIKDGEGNTLVIYGSYSADGKAKFTQLDPQPKSGDSITLYGIIGQYNDTPQLKNGWITKLNGKKPAVAAPTTRPSTGVKEPAANSKVTIADAIAIALSKEHNVYTTNKYYVEGTITELYGDAMYGNMRIKDSKGNVLTLYGTYYGETGQYQMLDLKTMPKAGDTIIVYGKIGQFGEVPQIKNGWINSINGKKPEIKSEAANKPTATLVDKPQVGVAYKFGLNQTEKGSVYFFTGVMSGYYGATDNMDINKAVDVFLEKADGGYKIYFKNASGTKQYIKLEQSGTHYNFTFGAEGSVFTYDEDQNAFCAPCGDQICYMGTYGSYVTVGCLTTEKLKPSDYIARFYIVE